MGYSMGGRMAMVLTETLSQRISSLVLIAPDGLKIKWVYRFVSETKIGRKIYRHIIDHPRWILRVADSLRFLGLLHQKIHRFVHVQLETREKRQLVYNAWLIHRNLFPNLKEVATHIESNDIPFLLLFGKFDRVIPAHDGRRLTTHFTRPTHQFLLELGHRLLHPTTAHFLGKYGWWMPMATPPK
jgi:pimeloyl-ACP methyl ester carboxylesterase